MDEGTVAIVELVTRYGELGIFAVQDEYVEYFREAYEKAGWKVIKLSEMYLPSDGNEARE